jgi:type III pantothenate kinase
MNIVIDSGNTSTKTGFFEAGRLIEVKRIRNEEFNLSSLVIPDGPVIISSVSSVDFSVLEKRDKVLILDQNTPTPVKNRYNSPGTLGMDRLAAVAGALSLFPGKAALVINGGTCITYDFINQNSEYEGGSISPGINMRFKALNHYTARLPLIEFPDGEIPFTGKTTRDAILSGVLNGVLAETEGIIARYRQSSPGCIIIISGGDVDFFERNIKGDIFAVPDLVLLGLNSILEYNESL